MAKSLLFSIFLLTSQVFALQQSDQSFLVITGKESDASRGDTNHRAVFKIKSSSQQKVYIRVFDADAGGLHDEITTESKSSYRLYKNGDYLNKLSINDTISASPISEIIIGKDERYDNQWKTIAEIEPSPIEEVYHFIIDGIEGKGTNLYKVALSKNRYFNETALLTSIESQSISLRPITKANFSTQIYFQIPAGAKRLNVHLYDAEDRSKIYFESDLRRYKTIKHSRNDQVSTTEINLIEGEASAAAAIIVDKNQIKQENFQLWLSDDTGKKIPMNMNFNDVKMNSLPKAKLMIHPTQSCTELTLDASQSTDADNDLFSIEWLLPNGQKKRGLVINHDFGKAGNYPIQLILKDNSGQVAHTTRFKETVVINQAPIAKINLAKYSVANEDITLDASESYDSDGKIVDYVWEISGLGTFRGKTIKKRFKYPGIFPVKLIVKDNGKYACSTAEARAVIIVNAEPVPLIEASPIGAIDESIKFDASASSDSDGKIVAYNWTFSDGSKKSGKIVYHSFKEAGKFTAKLEVLDEANISNSRKSVVHTIKINSAPEPVITLTSPVSTKDINTFSAAKSTDSDGKIISYVWDFGDGGKAEGIRVKHQYKSSGKYRVSLRVQDNSTTKNDTKSISKEIRVNIPPSPHIDTRAVITESVASFDASASSDPDDEIISYLWSFGDQSTAKGALVNHVYAQSGTYNVKLLVTDASGTKTKTQSITKTVRVNALPLADAGTDIVAAVNTDVVLNASASRDLDGTIRDYIWKISDGTTKTGAEVSHRFNTSGIFTADLIVIDNDASESYDQVKITVNSAAVIQLADIPRIAPNQSLNFDASNSYDKDGEITSVRWFFGDEEKALRGYKVKKSFKSAAIVPIRVEVTDNSSASNQTSVLNSKVHINHAPEADAGNDIFTDQLLVNFSAAASSDKDNENLSYTWQFGDGSSADGFEVSHRYSKAGVFPVTLIVDDNEGLSNSKQRDAIKVHINSTPIAKIVAASVVCAGDPVLFDASSSSDPDAQTHKYEWNFGDGNKASGVSPVHQFASSGYYNVTLRLTDNSNLSNATAITKHLIYVSSAPVANAGLDQTVCANTVVQFDGSKSSGGDKELSAYEWDFDDGNQGGGMKPTHVFTKEGVYNVRLSVSVADNGDCPSSSSEVVQITVLPAPEAIFSLAEEAAIGEAIKFDASKSNAGSLELSEYIWDFGDSTIVRGKIQSHSFKNFGTYTVKLTVKTSTDQGCSTAEMSRKIKINKAPQAEISLAEKAIYVNDYVSFSAAASSDDDGKIASYNWRVDQKELSNNIEFVKQFSEAGNYSIELTVRDQTSTKNNSHSTRKEITVLEREKLEITGPSAICLNDRAEFKSNGVAGTWQVGREAPSTQAMSFSPKFNKAGNYHIYFKTASAFASHTIEVHEDEKVELFADASTIELSQKLNLVLKNVTIKNYTILWEIDGKPINAKAKLSHSFKEAGNHLVKVTLSHKKHKCAALVVQKNIVVLTAPELAISVKEESLFAGGVFDKTEFSAIINNNYNNAFITWTFGDGSTANAKNVKHKYKKAGRYTVTLTVSDASIANAKKHTVRKIIEVKKR